MRRRSAEDGASQGCTESTCRDDPRCRDGTHRRAAFSPRSEKGGNATDGGRRKAEGRICRSRDRWHARFRRPTSPTGLERRTEGSCVTTSRRHRFEIARRDALSLALVSCSLPSRLRVAANKIACGREAARDTVIHFLDETFIRKSK